MALLRIGGQIARILAASVARAFDEMKSRNGREALQVFQLINQRLPHQPVDQQFVGGRIEVRYPRVVPLEVERRGRNNPVGVLERRTRRPGRGSLRFRRQQPYRRLVWRPVAVLRRGRPEQAGSLLLGGVARRESGQARSKRK